MPDAPLIAGGLPGWFGKLPSVGDFASRRLPDDFIRCWDRWLQQGLAHARGEAGAAWLDAYLVAPIRRFWVAPSVVSDLGWAGVLMPSVDRVGRHFPLTVAQPSARLATALAARAWFNGLDSTARRVLDTAFTIADFEHALAQVARVDAAVDDDAARRLADRLLDGAFAHRASVWWCDEAGETTPFLCFAGLPPPSAVASMMGGAP